MLCEHSGTDILTGSFDVRLVFCVLPFSMLRRQLSPPMTTIGGKFAKRMAVVEISVEISAHHVAVPVAH